MSAAPADSHTQREHATDARERTLELRALASASDASKSWDLCCEVREKLVAYLRRAHPDSLPQLRARIARMR